MTYTQGPWTVHKDDDMHPRFAVFAQPDGETVEIAAVWDSDADGRDEGNAHLIAAAPDLLAACELASGARMFGEINHADIREWAREVKSALDGAIAKARGIQS